MSKLICIDPGASGAIVTYDDVCMDIQKMPEGMTAICQRLKELSDKGFKQAVVERVGGYMPGNSGPAAATFARHCGWLDASMFAYGIALKANPTPQQWMKSIGVPKMESKQDRKKWIKEWVQKRMPVVPVPLYAADAVALMLIYKDQT